MGPMSGARQGQRATRNHEHDPPALASAAGAEHISDRAEEPGEENRAAQMGQRIQRPTTTTAAARGPLSAAAAASSWQAATQTTSGASMASASQLADGLAEGASGKSVAVLQARQTKKRAAAAGSKGRKNQPQQQQQQQPSELEDRFGCYDTPESDVQFSSRSKDNCARVAEAPAPAPSAIPASLGSPQPRCSSQAASSGQQPPMLAPSPQPQRPRSALAGSLAAAAADSTPIAASSAPRAALFQANKLQQQQQLAGGCHSTLAISNQRAKTTRVRINSTSEQIQDPNWLIRMSQELELQRQQQKRGHLKALHRKLKSTLANTISGGGGGNGGDPSMSPAAAATTSVGGGGPAHLQSPSLPATPTKMPVSILKQRKHAAAATATAPGQVGGAAALGATSARSPARKSPVPPAGQQAAASSSATRPTSQVQRDRPAKHAAPSKSIIDDSARPASAAATSSQLASSQQLSDKPDQAAPTIKPICADGQVKVSGWKRNNLLAKTLSHFDEIRGNQRPVFVPTKIKLPPTEAGLSGGQQQLGVAGGGGSGRPTKFAEIVREAVSKKKLLASGAGSRAHAEPSAICSLLQQQQAASKRASSGSDHSFRGADLGPAEPDSAAAHRCLSADEQHAAVQQEKQHHQVRSSSAAGSPPNGASTRIQRQHQHQAGRAPSRQGAQTPLGQLQISQLLSQQQHSPAAATPAASAISQQQASPSSSRQFKLQLKNNQVLQNLRRQSNEVLQAQAHAHADAEAAAGSHQLASSHLKDWKRLAGKLALLTGGGGGSARHATSGSSPISTSNRNLLSVLSGNQQHQHQLLVHGQAPLRLTVSNEEQSTSGQARRASRQLQLPSSPAASTASAGEQARKLSSSSMVVQPVSSSRRQLQIEQEASSCLANAGFDLQEQEQEKRLRRSSDSEAYRNSQPNLASRHLGAAKPLAGSQQETSRNDFEQANSPIARPAIVVNRNDLLQLLQVTAGGGGGESSLLAPTAAADRCAAGGNLRTQSDSGVAPPAAAAAREADFGSSKSVDTLLMEAAPLSAEPQRLKRRPGDIMQRDISAEASNLSASPSHDEGSPLFGAAITGERQADEAPHSEQQQPQQPPAADLSWVVRQTSKVAFFQQKLRKMRWHSKQQQQQQQPTVETTKKSKQQPAAGDGDESDERRRASAAKCGDVFMDPELIGDAIEIFLRSTMQINNNGGAGGAAAARPARAADGASGESRELTAAAADSDADEGDDEPATRGQRLAAAAAAETGMSCDEAAGGGGGGCSRSRSELACGSQD